MADTNIETDETATLIASNKVAGTAVFNREGEKLGTIHALMIEQHLGHVEYAVLQFGGVFDLGSDLYPLPWEKLSYDHDRGGYVVDIDEETLEDAPHYESDEEPIFNSDFGSEIYGYYGLAYPG